MFSQRSGADQSIGSSVMSGIFGLLVQKMMIGGSGGVWSILSGLGGLNNDHALVRHVQQNAGIQVRQYTQHGVDILNEQSNNNPERLKSLRG
jgi:hypothetical protein